MDLNEFKKDLSALLTLFVEAALDDDDPDADVMRGAVESFTDKWGPSVEIDYK